MSRMCITSSYSGSIHGQLVLHNSWHVLAGWTLLQADNDSLICICTYSYSEQRLLGSVFYGTSIVRIEFRQALYSGRIAVSSRQTACRLQRHTQTWNSYADRMILKGKHTKVTWKRLYEIVVYLLGYLYAHYRSLSYIQLFRSKAQRNVCVTFQLCLLYIACYRENCSWHRSALFISSKLSVWGSWLYATEHCSTYLPGHCLYLIRPALLWVCCTSWKTILTWICLCWHWNTASWQQCLQTKP